MSNGTLQQANAGAAHKGLIAPWRPAPSQRACGFPEKIVTLNIRQPGPRAAWRCQPARAAMQGSGGRAVLGGRPGEVQYVADDPHQTVLLFGRQPFHQAHQLALLLRKPRAIKEELHGMHAQRLADTLQVAGM